MIDYIFLGALCREQLCKDGLDLLATILCKHVVQVRCDASKMYVMRVRCMWCE